MVSRAGGSVLTSVATSLGLTSGVPLGASAQAYTYARHGFELATAYSELVDPVIQRECFIDQARQGAAGDVRAMRLDEEFLRALELGKPPSGGLGIGIDRLLMALTGLVIREIIHFPLVR